MKKNVSRVPKLKMDASQSRLPPVRRTIPLMTIPHNSIVNTGTPRREMVDSTSGRTPRRAIANRARDPPMMEAMITEVVANSADTATNSRMKILSVTAFSANSSGALEDPSASQTHDTHRDDRNTDVDQGADRKGK